MKGKMRYYEAECTIIEEWTPYGMPEHKLVAAVAVCPFCREKNVHVFGLQHYDIECDHFIKYRKERNIFDDVMIFVGMTYPGDIFPRGLKGLGI